MKRKLLALILGLCMVLALAGCASETETEGSEAGTTAKTEAAEETASGQTEEETPGEAQEETAQETGEGQSAEGQDGTVIRIGSLSGPTSMGLVSLMEKNENGEAQGSYEFTMATAADEINASFLRGDLDIVLIPANVASVLYNRTEGEAVVLDINTLGVLYLLESGDSIQSVADLEGRTIYLPGRGTTPDYALQYVLAQNGLTTEDVDLQYKAEAAEVISALAEEPDAVGLLPQPAVTTALMQNDSLRIALDLTEEWDKVSQDSSLVTGVTVVNRTFLEENEAAVQTFIAEHQESAAYANENVEEAAQLVAQLGIVPQAAIAAQAIPYCNITCLTGGEMQTALSGYLEVLFGQNAESVGGALPGDDFYYMP